jgi:hypothetical protein
MDQPMKKLALGLLLSFGGLSAALAQGSNRIDAYGNFIPNMGGTQTIAATTTSASVTLTATDLQNTDLNLFNLGTGLVFCRWGNGAQTAVLTDMPVPVGAIEDILQVPGDQSRAGHHSGCRLHYRQRHGDGLCDHGCWPIVDKEVLLHIIDGPGTTWGWIAFGFFAMVTIITLARLLNGFDKGMQAGREAERRDSLYTIKAQMAKVIFDQEQIMNKLKADGALSK